MRLSELLRGLFGLTRGNAERASGTEACAEDEDVDVDPFDPFKEPVRLEITDVFDLHTIRPQEVGVVVVEYLDEARRKGFRQVRIIHGKGVGVQRGIVRNILARTPFVEHFADAPPEAGGWGATVVALTQYARVKDEGG